MRKMKINVYKYDRTPHYSWESEVLEETDEFILLTSKPPRALMHYTRNEIYYYDTTSIEFISKKEGYTINLDVYNDDHIEYYCNICTTPLFNADSVEIIDLDIDMIIDKNGDYYFVDEDEFEMNKTKYCYSDYLIIQVLKMKEQLSNLYEEQQFPFDGYFLKYISNKKK